MKAILKIYFLCLALKSVCGLPDFGDIPSLDELLLSSIHKDQDVCSNVTSYACISREVNNYISADYYKNEAESYIRKKATEILNSYTSQPELLNFDTEGEIAKFLKKEVEWYSMCKANDELSQTNLAKLKRIVMNSGGLQYIADVSIRWQYTVLSYALESNFNPFFEVILNDDTTLLFRRPSTMVSFKRLSDDGLTLLIDKFYSIFSIDSVNGLQMFTKAEGVEIKNSLNAAVTTFLNLLNNKDSKFIYMQVSKFINIMEEEITHDYDWMTQFQNLYQNITDDGSFFFDINYFQKLTLFLNKLKGGEIINLIHFLYTMNSMILTTWNNDESLSAFRYTEEECFTNMPMKFGIIRKVINDNLLSKYALIQNMFHNIVAEYVLEINNSWLDDRTKHFFLDLLRNLKLTTIEGSLDQKLMAVYHGKTVHTLLTAIRSAIEHRNYLINRIIADGLLKNRKYTTSQSINSNSQQLAPYVKYNHLTKSLEIKLTELCLPYFDSHLPRTWKYAYYGVAIARKISEFLLTYLDNEIRLSDSVAERVACFKRMQESVWDKVNLYELINNNVGLTMAYSTFKREQHLVKHPIKKFKGLNYDTLPQQFLLAYSAIYCQETIPEKVDLCASNLESFQRAFKCDLDSPMNREEKCKLWIRS